MMISGVWAIRRRKTDLLGLLEFCLYICAFIPGWLIGPDNKIKPSIVAPGIMLVMVVFVCTHVQTERLRVLQKLVACYLVCLLADRIAGKYLTVPVFGYQTNLSFGIVALALCTIGHLTGNLGSDTRLDRRIEKTRFWKAWKATFAVLLLHVLFLVVLLAWVYGFGYERSSAVLGRFGYFLLICRFFGAPLGNKRLRRIMAVMSVLGYVRFYL